MVGSYCIDSVLHHTIYPALLDLNIVYLQDLTSCSSHLMHWKLQRLLSAAFSCARGKRCRMDVIHVQTVGGPVYAQHREKSDKLSFSPCATYPQCSGVCLERCAHDHTAAHSPVGTDHTHDQPMRTTAMSNSEQRVLVIQFNVVPTSWRAGRLLLMRNKT